MPRIGLDTLLSSNLSLFLLSNSFISSSLSFVSSYVTYVHVLGSLEFLRITSAHSISLFIFSGSGTDRLFPFILISFAIRSSSYC